MAKKSLYIFLTSLLGAMVFLILHRIVVFIFLYAMASGSLPWTADYNSFIFWDSFTLTITIMLGAWYGIWIGLFWYAKVYEEQTHGGLVHHLAKNHWFGRPNKTMPSKMVAIKDRLQDDMSQLEHLTKVTVAKAASIEPKARRVVRKRAPKS